MTKKLFERALSLILTLVLIVTTFFIFDPSVLKIDSKAYVEVNPNEAAATLATQDAAATETIYLKAGSSAFQYYLNYNNTTGVVNEARSTSGSVHFKNNDATEITLAVNRVYYKGGTNGTTDTNCAGGSLKINNTTIYGYANCGATATNFVNSSATILSTVNATTLNYSITNGSLTGATENKTYFIEWVVRYKINNVYHLMFMYTGVYCPSTNITAVATASRYTGTGSTPEIDSIALVTGAMKYSTKGNRYHSFTNKSVKTWGSATDATDALTIPLLSFVGYKNNSSQNTIPNRSRDDTRTFPTTGDVANKTVLVTGARQNKEYPEYYTPFTSYGSYSDPNPVGTAHSDCNAAGYQTGVAYLVVDISRYTNYNQIPNFSAGFITTYKKSGGYESKLAWINAKPTDNIRSGDVNGIYCTVDTADHDGDGDGTASRTFGLYPLNGPIYDGGFQLAFRYQQGVNFGVGHRTVKPTTGIGIHTTTVSKENIRLVYNRALHTNIDKVNVDASTTPTNPMNYVNYYSRLKAVGEVLCDPTATSIPSDNSTLEGYITDWNRAISDALDASVYFYVPEIIYLNPIANNNQYAFRYYVDRENVANGNLTANGEDTGGNVFFKSASASRVVSVSASIDGGNVSLTQTSSSTGELTSIMSGYSTTYADKKITWTCKYIDKASGKEMTATAFTRCVIVPKATAASTVISASAQAGYNSGTHTDTNIGVTGWIVGAYSVDAKAYTITSQSAGNVDNGNPGDGRGGYKNNYLENNTTVPTNGEDNIQNLYDNNYRGGSGYYAKDSNVNWTTGGKGTIYIDSSRYTNLGQIPMLYVGIDCNYRKNKSADMKLYYDWYSNGSNKNPTTYTAASQNGVSTGNTQRGKKLTSAGWPLKTTTTNTLVLHAWSKSYGNSNRTAQASCYLLCLYRDKSLLREAYEYMLKNSTYLQQEYFTTGTWSTFNTYRNYVYDYLLNPKATTAQITIDNYAKQLYNQVAKMSACVKADAGSTSATYKEYGATTNTTVTRSAVLNTGTVKVYHRYISGGSGSSTTTLPLNEALGASSTTHVETKTYYFGETVLTGYNETNGYDYFGYYRATSDTQWTSPSNGNLVGNGSGANMYGSSGHNRDPFATYTNLTYTYVYHKKTVSVFKDYGGSEQDYGTVTNKSNLANATVSHYTTWGAAGGGASFTNKTSTTLNVDVTSVGTNSSNGLRYNDIYITNAATGLTAGGTYTVSFKSNYEYDEKAWFGESFNANGGWDKKQDYHYVPDRLQLYVLGVEIGKEPDGTTPKIGDLALTKVETRFSEGGTIGTFKLPSNVTSVNMILRIMSDGTSGDVVNITDFKIAQGRYVDEGVADQQVSLGSPTRTGYTFTGWVQNDSPFDGTLSGTQYTFGKGDDTVLATWRINKYDVMFANEFDFDSWRFAGVNTGSINNIDKDTNSITITTSSTDSYTLPYDGANAPYMTLTPGHTYRFSYDYEQETGSVAGKLRIMTFCYPSPANMTSSTWTATNNYKEIAATETGNHSFTFTVPTGKPTMSFRFGTSTAGMHITFRNILVQDITTVSGVANITEPKVGTTRTPFATVNYNTTLSTSDNLGEPAALPTITSSGYTFVGWYNNRNTNGNGTGTKYELTSPVIGASNVKLFPRWTVSVTYSLGTGGYMLGGLAAPQNRSSLEPGTSIAVSNRIAQNQTNWNSTSMSYLSVPCRLGYNFAGWKATSVDTAVNNKIYWPGQSITAKANVTLTAQWTAAPTTTLGAENTIGTSNNGYTFFPGQVYYVKYTPSRAMYVSGYTYGTGTTASPTSDPTMTLYNPSNVAYNDNYPNTHGLTDMTQNTKNAKISYGMTANTEYTYAIYLSSNTASSTSTIKFKIVEHTVAYTLAPNGGSVSPTTATGYYNTATTLPTPARTGYTFSGWKAGDTNAVYTGSVPAADNNTRITGNTASLTKAVTLTAQWNINQYALNVYAQYNLASSATSAYSSYARGNVGGTVKIGSGTAGATATANINYGSTTTITAAAKTGYTFEGWYSNVTLNASNGTTVTAWGTRYSTSATVTTATMGTGGLKYYAKFTIKSYTIGVYAFYNETGTNNLPNETTFIKGATGGTIGLRAADLDQNLSQLITVSTATVAEHRNYIHGQTVTIYAKPKTGYEFDGWINATSWTTSPSSITSTNAIPLTTAADPNLPKGNASSDGFYSCAVSNVTSNRHYIARFKIKTYNLVIQPNGGTYAGSTGETTITQCYGTTYTVADPTRTGFTFKGWSINPTSVTLNNKVYTFRAGQTTLTATWAVNNYAITINPNGGTCSNVTYYKGSGNAGDVNGASTNSGSFTASTTFQMAYNTTASITPPTRTGYTFTGWTKSAGSGTLTNGNPVTSANASFKVTNATATLTAGWQINQYTLTVKAYSNTGAAQGTFANNTTGGTVKIGSGTAGASVTAQINYGATASITATAATGYTFKGWQTAVPTSSNGTGLTTTNPLTTAAMGTGGLTYYARFEIKTYSVNISAAHDTATPGTFVAGTTGGTVSGGGTKYHGQQVSLSATTNAGYDFIGWFASTTATTATSTANPYTPTITGNVTLVAKFRVKTYTLRAYAYSDSATQTNYTNNATGGTVKIGTNGTAGAIATANVYLTKTASIIAAAKTGYTFGGWYASPTVSSNTIASNAWGSQFSSSATATTAAMGTSGLNYYAKFSVKTSSVTVYAYSNTAVSLTQFANNTTGGTVHIDGGTQGQTSTNNFKYGANYTVRAYPATGYEFGGWYTDDTFTTEATANSYELGGAYSTYYYRRFTKAVDGAESIYAKFTIKTYKLTVKAYSNTGAAQSTYANNATGGTVKIGSGTAGATAEAQVYFGQTASITAAAKTGYAFGGWYTSTTFTGNAISTASTFTTAAMGTSGLTYYAKFNVQSFTITFNPNNGASSSTTTAQAWYNTEWTLPSAATPTRTGFAFKGWSETQFPDYASDATIPEYDPDRHEETKQYIRYGENQQIAASVINGWYTSGGKTLYAVWQDIKFGLHVYSAYQNGSVYTIGDVGGTAAKKQNVDSIATGTNNLLSYIDYAHKAGYEYVGWKYGSTVPSGTVNSWGSNGYAEYQMPQSALHIVVLFGLKNFDIKVYAKSDSATSVGSYTNSAIGGTVRIGDGLPGASAEKIGVQYNTSMTLTASPVTGYEFGGWYKDEGLTQELSSNAVVNVKVGDDRNDSLQPASADIPDGPGCNTYYAKFTVQTYQAKAGSEYHVGGFLSSTGPGSAIPGVQGGTATVASGGVSATTRSDAATVTINVYRLAVVAYTANAETGYEFVGWYATANADPYTATPISSQATYQITMPANDVSMHAKFIPYNFTLVLNANGGSSGVVTEIILTYNQPIEQPIRIPTDAIPTRMGYNFLGWADGQNSTVNPLYNGVIPVENTNSWFDDSLKEASQKTIYAIWSLAQYTVTLDQQGGTGGVATVTVRLGNLVPDLTSVPTYSGYNFKGYYTGIGGTGDRYYNSVGTGEKLWDMQQDQTLYAYWTCPVLVNVTYSNGEWTYEYEAEGTGTVTNKPTQQPVSAGGSENPTSISDLAESITDTAPQGAKEISSIADSQVKVSTYLKEKNTALDDINLNHYKTESLDMLWNSAKETTGATEAETQAKLRAMSQPELNAHLANMAMHSADTQLNKKITDNANPSIKLYDTKTKVEAIKSQVLTARDSVNGTAYSVPNRTEAASYTYSGKYSYTQGGAVDYYLYTNSPTPVIAVEINDGANGTSAASYPTKAAQVSDNSASLSYVNGSHIKSAVRAAGTSWFSKYTGVGIGTKYDYNAKAVVYLTPTFSSSGTKNEIVYTITPEDDATSANRGLFGGPYTNGNEDRKSDIATTEGIAIARYSSHSYNAGEKVMVNGVETEKESITICICYHNAMNGTSDEGGSGPYLQMSIDQVDDDTWLNQMHLFRQSGGASNWELPGSNESVYPIADTNYTPRFGVLGSFMYVFDATNEPEATAYAESGNYTAAKNAIISSVDAKASDVRVALMDRANSLNINGSGTGLGFAEVTGWSTNFYPKQGSYVYAHLVDRWGNVFNKVWKCFNVDQYASTVSLTPNSTGYTVLENGGSNLNTITLDSAQAEFILDSASTFENGVFTTPSNTFSVNTGEANKQYSIAIADKAGNITNANVTTDSDGILTLSVEDTSADLTSGAYTFEFNSTQVNLYSGQAKLIRSASTAQSTFIGDTTDIKVVTDAQAIKVQLVENGSTRTYNKDSSAVTVTENEDGTLTWVISVKLPLGDHTISLRARKLAGWEDSDITVNNKVIKLAEPAQDALVSVTSAVVDIGVKPQVSVKVKQGTEAVRFITEDGGTITVRRSDEIVTSTADGIETWLVTLPTRGISIQVKYSLIALYDGKWQRDNAKELTVTFEKQAQAPATIYSVEADSNEVKVGSTVTYSVTTNTQTSKIQYIYPNSGTLTFTADNATVTDLGSGKKLWTVSVRHLSVGNIPISFRARTSSDSWGDSLGFGEITVTE